MKEIKIVRPMQGAEYKSNSKYCCIYLRGDRLSKQEKEGALCEIYLKRTIIGYQTVIPMRVREAISLAKMILKKAKIHGYE